METTNDQRVSQGRRFKWADILVLCAVIPASTAIGLYIGGTLSNTSGSPSEQLASLRCFVGAGVLFCALFGLVILWAICRAAQTVLAVIQENQRILLEHMTASTTEKV